MINNAFVVQKNSEEMHEYKHKLKKIGSEKNISHFEFQYDYRYKCLNRNIYLYL